MNHNFGTGYILLYRSLLRDESAFKNPCKTLAWIDFIAMASHDDYKAKKDGVMARRGEVIASYEFLARRWHISKSTAHGWIREWIDERRIERRSERCYERNAERFFVLNYAEYQRRTERMSERTKTTKTKRDTEPIQEIDDNSPVTIHQEQEGVSDAGAPDAAKAGFVTELDLRLARSLGVMLLTTNPAHQQKYGTIEHKELQKKIATWAIDIEMMRRIDKVEPEQIVFILQWLKSDQSRDAIFWQSNISSGRKLRQQFPKLIGCIKLEYAEQHNSKNRIESV